MLKNKNRLIQPSHFSKEQNTNKNDFFYRAYLNALQYYMDDPTCDYDNISFPAMYLYSLGDKNIKNSPDVKLDEFGDKKIEEPSPQVKKQIEFYSNNLVSALQFRLQDRKYVLDINTYKYNDLEDFLDVNVNVNVAVDVDDDLPLFPLLMRNFSLKYFKDVDAKDKDSDTLSAKLFEKLNASDRADGDFDGVFDEKKFQERYAKKDDNHRQILELDGYFKSELKEWKDKYEKRSLVDTNAIDLYPYVNGILYDNNKYFIAIALTERDENYIDDKTEEINKVFECSMFIYKNENETIKTEQLSGFNENLNYYLGRFVNKCSLYKLQEAMNGAIGEAADISRYWYSKGLDSIFNTETAKEFENSEDSIEFYTKFVKELLCRIDGVKNTEIYPFDRVYLFPETGLDNKFEGIANIRVLEAKVKSRDPYDRGSYLMGWEQDVSINETKLIDEANDLIFSDKKINYMDWDFRNRRDVFVNSITNVNKKHIRGNLLLSNLLLEQEFLATLDESDPDYKKLVNMKRKIRDEFNEYGLYYEYDFGLTLKEQFPVLFDLQNKYLDEMAKDEKSDGVEYNEKDYNINLRVDKDDKDKKPKYRKNTKYTLIQNMKKNIEEDYKAKTITICFDPERITKPELAQAATYLKRKDAITMVFVADKDFVKTTSELEAEIKDFEVLIQMLIRQVIYNTESAAKEIEIKRKVFSVADQALHDAKAIAKDHREIQDQIDNLMIQVKEKLNTEGDSSSNAIVFKSTNVYNEILNRFFEDRTALSNSIGLESKISEWLPKNHNIHITLHESFLPKMKMLWDDLSISKSFKVLLKNAAEYCGMYSQSSNDASLTLSMSTETLDNHDFLVVNIINTTPPLTKSRFDMLNNEEINELGKDSKKEGSTGVGVVSARRQIKSISSFNNITFTMLSSNVISAKMYLKVELLNENNLFLDEAKELDKVQSTSEQEDMNSYDVVYFEDSREYYNENIPLLKKYNVSVAHSVRKDESYMSDAKLLLTDMSILNSNDEADEEEGLEGIYLFKKHNTKNAPICVLSNGEAGSIKNKILEHLDEMISPDDVLIVKDFSATLDDGKIFILNNVKTLDNTHSIVFDYLNTIGSNEIKDDEVKEQENYELVQFTNNGDYTPEFDKLFSNLEHDISQKYFYIAQSSHTEVELTDILNKWLAFKTVRANKGDRKFAISNVTYHKNTLLIIDDIVLEDEREKWWLFYLGVKHNIIFNFLAKEHSDIVAQWSEVAVKRESSGYLGKLRHDVKNYQKIYEKNLKNTKLDTEFENIINATLELQKLLHLNKYESLKHFTLLPQKEKLEKLTGETSAMYNEDIFKYANEIEKTTKDLQSSLKSAIEIMGNHTKDKTNISNLISFKELIDFNVEFCTNNIQVSA